LAPHRLAALAEVQGFGESARQKGVDEWRPFVPSSMVKTMAARVTVIFYIILSLEVGLALVLLPWIQPFGLGDWGDNYLLLYAAQKTGLVG
ncbi:hypothetical protein OFO11_33025, partial [Escherichia coli]|nr:hypothetical protein [Escherichia coli]